MVKLGMLSVVLAMVSILTAARVSAEGAAACKRTKFETTLVKDACAKGGQPEAKTAMKAFVKQAKKQDPDLDCGACHNKLAPNYPLKPDGLDKFKKLGGK